MMTKRTTSTMPKTTAAKTRTKKKKTMTTTDPSGLPGGLTEGAGAR